ncbi:MAG TPA: nucleoside deaminase [Bacillota bacterium]|jgi:tRNA(Arg) A34 adenosine deaminase TadA|nr:nucleoside deaminase [Fastidiosipila sp.]HPX93740.1 nucleoside deaminase [Bacillota bacterium]HQB81589.1 nucleoside deaminase [Bacillota bacterium]
MLTEKDRKHLKRAVELAREALEKGDAPFGSVLVSGEGEVLMEARNQVGCGDHTQHPEFNLARWAAEHMTDGERRKATVYTSGEHCPMCSAAHGWVDLGRIVYASSSAQLAGWLEEMGIPPGRVRNLSIQEVIRDSVVEGPVPEFEEEIHKLQRQYHLGRS